MLNRVGFACGFDLRAVNAHFTARYFPVRIDRHRHRVLSESLLIANTATSAIYRPHRPRPVSRAGTVHGLVSWFSADLGAATITNEPYVNGHWHQAFHPLPTDLPVAVGQVLDVAIDDHGHATASVR